MRLARMSMFSARRHRAFYIAVPVGLAVFLTTFLFKPEISLVLGANAFFATYLIVIALNIGKLTPEHLRAHADEEDAPAPFLLLAAVIVVAASAGQLFFALAATGDEKLLEVWLGVTSVVLGWFALHTMWATHYAYEYYESPKTSPKVKGQREIVGGIEFPGEEPPDGWTFLYFAYVLGMTAQTSDVSITSNAMRKIVLAQSVFAFFFNTVILAAAVNIAVTLGQ